MKNKAFPLIDDDAVSALADGALAGAALEHTLAHLSEDGEARACWHAYHVVGDVLRSNDLAGRGGDLAFLARLEARLALEPSQVPVLGSVSVSSLSAVDALAPAQTLRPAANGDVFRWKMAAGFASLAAVAAIGWQVLQIQSPGASGPMLAQAGGTPSAYQAVRADLGAPAETPTDSGPVMLRNAQLDELLAQHNRAVGGAALQSQAHLLRNVSISEDYPR